MSLCPLFGQEVLLTPTPSAFLVVPQALSQQPVGENILSSALVFNNRFAPWNSYRTLFADVQWAPHERNALNLRFFSDQQTQLFSMNHVQLGYAHTVALNTQTLWTLGMQAGLSNIFYQATGATVGASAWNWNSQFYSEIKVKDWTGAASLFQIPEQTLTPVGFVFVLSPAWNLSTRKRLPVGFHELNLGLRTLLFAREWFPSLDAQFLWNDRVMLFATVGEWSSGGVGWIQTSKQWEQRFFVAVQQRVAATGPANASIELGLTVTKKRQERVGQTFSSLPTSWS